MDVRLGVDTGVRRVAARLGRGSGRAWLVVSLVAMTLLFWAAARSSSVTVDGVRYHYLDDDQMISRR